MTTPTQIEADDGWAAEADIDIETIRQGFAEPVPSISTLMAENMQLKAEIERLKEELAISEQAVGVSEWRRQECLRLRAVLSAFFDRENILGTDI